MPRSMCWASSASLPIATWRASDTQGPIGGTGPIAEGGSLRAHRSVQQLFGEVLVPGTTGCGRGVQPTGFRSRCGGGAQRVPRSRPRRRRRGSEHFVHADLLGQTSSLPPAPCPVLARSVRAAGQRWFLDPAGLAWHAMRGELQWPSRGVQAVRTRPEAYAFSYGPLTQSSLAPARAVSAAHKWRPAEGNLLCTTASGVVDRVPKRGGFLVPLGIPKGCPVVPGGHASTTVVPRRVERLHTPSMGRSSALRRTASGAAR